MFGKTAVTALAVFATVATLLGFSIWVYDRSGGMHWLGHTDLDIEFEVVAAENDMPIADAHISILVYGGFYDNVDAERGKTVELRTDIRGLAQKQCLDDWCIGTRSGLRFTDTRHVYLPEWYVQVFADDFEKSEWIDIAKQYRGKTVHIGIGKDCLKIRIALKRK
jgi:hypothetical protein